MTYGIYNSDGSIRTTTVDGSTRTGIYAADGSINIVLDDTTYKGLYHPCGAFRVNSNTTTRLIYDASGAYYLGTLLGGAGGSGPAAPSAPTIIFVSESAGVLSYSWDVDATIGIGDTLTYQYQTAGAGWVSPTSVPHTILPGEDIANIIAASLTLGNGTWDIRGYVTKTSTGLSSGFSNVDAARVVSDAVTSNLRIASTGNRRISSAGNNRKAA